MNNPGCKAKRFHELGFYYRLTLPESFAAREPWEGVDAGVRLFFRWHPVEELASLPLLPAVLAGEVAEPPASTRHLVSRE